MSARVLDRSQRRRQLAGIGDRALGGSSPLGVEYSLGFLFCEIS